MTESTQRYFLSILVMSSSEKYTTGTLALGDTNELADDYRCVDVAVPTPLRRQFTYKLPSSMPKRLGARVLVPFGRQKLIGIVVATDTTPRVEPAKLKTVLEIYSANADVPAPLLDLCAWAATYYHYPIGEVLAAALPNQIRSDWDPVGVTQELALSTTGLALDIEDLKRAPAQRALILLLQSAPRSKLQLNQADIKTATIKLIRDKGWADWQPCVNEPEAITPYAGTNPGNFTITQEQSAAIDEIGKLPAGHHQTYLIDGITGSGKTEVYLQAIDRVLADNRQALVLVPEIGLTPQTIERFRARFNAHMVVLHSGLTDKERATGWHEANTGRAAIILGTRSAIFTPMARPGMIVVDEEHDGSYKQTDGFRYSARDLAVLRGQNEHVPVLLGSATPSLESLHNVSANKYQRLVLRSRPPGIIPEHYELIDTRHLQVIEGFTNGLRLRIQEHLTQGNQVLIFINRRGFAPVMLCQDCGWIAQCRRCDAKMTVHLRDSSLICHHCGWINHNLVTCQHCSGNRITPLGHGTQRVESTLSGFFPDHPVIRIDRDSTRRKNAMADFLDIVHQGEPAILVGTQLLAKGHHFPNVTLVALLDIDAGFYSSDYRALERLGQLVLQVGGRAGRDKKSGSVLIQSAFAEHPLLEKLIKEGYEAFARDLLAERAEAELPPFSFQALIRAETADPNLAAQFLEQIAAASSPNDAVQILGPIPALMEKRAGRYRQLLILTSTQRAQLHKVVNQLMAVAEALPDAKKVRWAVDVDPIDLF